MLWCPELWVFQSLKFGINVHQRYGQASLGNHHGLVSSPIYLQNKICDLLSHLWCQCDIMTVIILRFQLIKNWKNRKKEKIDLFFFMQFFLGRIKISYFFPGNLKLSIYFKGASLLLVIYFKWFTGFTILIRTLRLKIMTTASFFSTGRITTTTRGSHIITAFLTGSWK